MNAIFQKPLLKSTAINMLNTYFSGDSMKVPHIDLKLGAKRINKDEIAAKSMIDLLLKNIDDDRKNIQSAVEKNDVKKLNEANHKLLGGLAYCGAPRLEQACQQLQIVLKNKDEKNIDHCARAVLFEIKALNE